MRFVLSLAFIAIFPLLGHSVTVYVPDNYPSIQDAIDGSANGDVIIVRSGTYPENIDFTGKAITVESESGPAVTTIDGGSPANPDYGSTVSFQSGEGEYSILDGFTITNGTGTLDGGGTSHNGGGIWCSYGSSPVIVNNIVTANTVDGEGGGIYCENSSSPDIMDNEITLNSTGSYDGGGGIYTVDGSPTIVNNTITQNTSGTGGGVYWKNQNPMVWDNVITLNIANTYGGGIFLDGSGTDCSGNTINQNTAEYGGGGIWVTASDSSDIENNEIDGNSINNTISWGGGGIGVYYSNPSITNNMIRGNSAELGGGVTFGLSSSGILTNNTIVENTATGKGGGVYCESSTMAITSSILWDNAAPNGPEIYWTGSSFSITYSDIEGGWTGLGNINDLPLFVTGPGGDYYLSQIAAGQLSNSPCVDTGNPGGLMIDGTTRTDEVPDSGVVDMGFHYELPPFTLTLSPDPLVAGQSATFTLMYGSPNEAAYLVYSTVGPGSVWIPQLNVTIDLANPKKAFGPTPTNSSGSVSWTVTVPSGAAGVDAWLQGVQYGLATNVVATTVQ